MISIALIMALVAAFVGLLIGVLIFGSIDNAIDCPIVGQLGFEECNKAKSTAWVVISILPIAMFFAIFMIFGGLSGEEVSTKRVRNGLNEAKGVGEYVGGRASNGSNIVLKTILLHMGLAKRKK